MESDSQQFRRMRQTDALVFAAVIIAIASLVVIFALFGRFSLVGYPPFFFFFGWWWILIPLFFFGFFLLRWWWGWGYWWNSGRYYNDPALETLRERFARGEITKEQYEQMRKDLERW
ncbi:MAG TPA: SHOCT domain-containing protein [Nitrososphaerales archaeon]|nr:SHOCT domain-containing protein [Nitrososphaerales archaeon]